MEPTDFEQSNLTLQKPADMTDDECSPLPVWTDGEKCVSRWRASWSERLRMLFTGDLWLWVHSGRTQPPVSVSTDHPWR